MTLLPLACTGQIEGASSPTQSAQAGSPGGDGAEQAQAGGPGAGMGSAGAQEGPSAGSSAGAGQQAAPAEATTPSPRLRRLTLAQYRNSVRDLLGLQVGTELLTPVPPLNGLAAIGASTIALAEVDVEAFERLADELSARLFDDVAARSEFVGCDASEAGCGAAFVARFGRLAFRRPLLDEEQARYGALLQRADEMTGDPWLALRIVTSAFLQSPAFLYREELGLPDPTDPQRRLLTDYELASRLSFLVWNTTPDGALLDAAQSGALSTADGLGAQLERLLESERAAQAVESLFHDYLQLDGAQSLIKLPDVFPQMSETLGAAMARETTLALRTLAFERGVDFRTLFTTSTTFVNGELARLCGLPEPAAGFEQAQFPPDSERAGLVTHASFLASHSHAGRTSPTLRGKFIRENLLCQGIPPPPAGVDTTLPDTSGAATMRERLARHAEDPACAACHALMDPLGLALEHFDAIGAYRATDNGAELDVHGELDGREFVGAKGLGEALAEHPNLTACFTRILLRFARGQLEDRSEQPLVEALDARFEASGYAMGGLLRALVLHPAFRQVGALQ